ncbi:hypothetical protein [Flavobacterium pallidum]|uniref:TonB C-terminal domain-containing protein n=1 Tax=Flavobacterium pallidum TaxID=2172098 RepID=A0A2S1SKC4_9FLAO|nr:hypothetical protein [Flavobacterium pallidum]AWI26845.1 hypothetical protein HYN49_13570 [Flavobacterium pallidum]
MKTLIITAIFFLLSVSDLSAQAENKAFALCSEKINYSVDDMQLKQKFGQSLLTPNSNPNFGGGITELKKYFSENTLNNSKAKGIVFRVHVGFIVNCSGKAGSFELVNNGKGDLKILADEVLNIVAKMPQKWEAAMVDGKSIDSYQILSFTILDGDLSKVSYR